MKIPDIRRANGGLYSATAIGVGGSTTIDAVLHVPVPQHIQAPLGSANGQNTLALRDEDGGPAIDLTRVEVHIPGGLRPPVSWIRKEKPFVITDGFFQRTAVRRCYRILERWSPCPNQERVLAGCQSGAGKLASAFTGNSAQKRFWRRANSCALCSHPAA